MATMPVPASRLNGKADDLMPSVGKDYRLRKALEAVSDRYDFAILDTPPALDTLTVNALTAASWVVIPAQADAYSLTASPIWRPPSRPSASTPIPISR